MSIEMILEKIDAVIDAATKRDRQATREAFFNLDTKYDSYALTINSPIKQAKEIERDREISLTDNEKERIKDAFINLQTVETQRFAFTSIVSSHIFDPVEFNADIVKSVGRELKDNEKTLNNASNDVENIVDNTDLSPRPIPIDVNCGKSVIPFGESFITEFTVTNPGDNQLDTATANINVGGDAACSEIDIAPIDSGEVVSVQREVASPVAGEQLIEVSVYSPTLDVGRSNQGRIDIRSKKSYALFAIDNIATLRNTINDSESIPSEQKETIILELEAAIETTNEARETAEEDPKSNNTEEENRARQINSLFQVAKESLAQAKREYAIVIETNDIPTKLDATIRNHFTLSDKNLSEGQIAGLSQSGKNGQPRGDTTTNTICESSSPQAKGTRTQSNHVITDNQDSILTTIYITKVYKADTISVTDFFDPQLEVVGENSDGEVTSNGTIHFENIEHNSSSPGVTKLQYRVAPPEDINSEELPANFQTGPTEVEFDDSSSHAHTIGSPDWVVVTAESQDD